MNQLLVVEDDRGALIRYIRSLERKRGKTHSLGGGETLPQLSFRRPGYGSRARAKW